jgi:hypothetical protein
MQSCYAVRAEGGKPQLFLATKTQTELRGGRRINKDSIKQKLSLSFLSNTFD